MYNIIVMLSWFILRQPLKIDFQFGILQFKKRFLKENGKNRFRRAKFKYYEAYRLGFIG